MNSHQTKAFTLVELIVVISILAILATIAFLSFQNYSKSARDSSRATDMQTIYKGLKLIYLKNGSLEKPDNYVTILNGTNTLGYQGYAGSGTLNLIKLGGKGKDPTDNSYYSYYLDSTLKKVQLMGFLEENNQTLKLMGFENNYINTSLAASGSYIKRYPVVLGDKLGTLTYSDNTPIQDILTGSVDLAGAYSGTTFTSYFSNSSSSGTYVGSGSNLVNTTVIFRNYCDTGFKWDGTNCYKDSCSSGTYNASTNKCDISSISTYTANGSCYSSYFGNLLANSWFSAGGHRIMVDVNCKIVGMRSCYPQRQRYASGYGTYSTYCDGNGCFPSSNWTTSLSSFSGNFCNNGYMNISVTTNYSCNSGDTLAGSTCTHTTTSQTSPNCTTPVLNGGIRKCY